MNLHKQKEKINALSIRMITWADRAKLPTSNQQNHIPEVDRNGKIVPTWADVVNRANLGFEVMHERNAHNFPLDLASAESTSVALTAPQIG